MDDKVKIVYKCLGVSYTEEISFYDKDLNYEERLNFTPDDYIYAGDIEPHLVNEAVINIMDYWVKMWDVALGLKVTTNEKKEDIKRNLRFISYKEFMDLFNKPKKLEGEKTRYQYSVKEGREVPKKSFYTYEQEKLSLPFRHWNHRNDFIRSYSQDESGYHKFLQETDLPFKDFFLLRLPYIIPESDLQRHVVVRGKTGSGKSEFLKILIYSIMKKKKSSIVIIEPHGDLSKQVAMWKEFGNEKNKERLIYIDPFLKDGFTPSINPFYLKDKSEGNISTLTQQLIIAFESLMKNEFTPNMKGVLMYCIPVLLRRDGSTLEDLKRFVTDGENEDLIDIGLNSGNRIARDFFLNTFKSRKIDSTKTSLSIKISTILALPIFARLLTGKNSFDFEKAFNSGKVIIFNLSKGVLGKDVSNAYGIFVVAMTQYYAFKRASIFEQKRARTFIFIDEFHNYVCKDMSEILAETRKYRLHMVLANQYEDQVNTETKSAVKENTQIKVFGRSDEGEFKNYKAGEFLIHSSANKGKPLKIFTPKFLLGNKNSMDVETWKKVKEYQIEKFYTKIDIDGNYEKDETETVYVKEEIKQTNVKFEEKEKNDLPHGFKPDLGNDMDIEID